MTTAWLLFGLPKINVKLPWDYKFCGGSFVTCYISATRGQRMQSLFISATRGQRMQSLFRL